MKGHLFLYPEWLESFNSGWIKPAVACLCLLSFLVSGAVYADADQTAHVDSNVANVPESIYLEARGGFSLHVSRYRPEKPATGALILIHNWTMAGLSCWGSLPDSLCNAGFDVFLPDLRGHGLSRAPVTEFSPEMIPTSEEMAVLESDAAIWLDLISTSTQRIGLLCSGSMGALAPSLARREARIRDIVWVSPESIRTPGNWEFAQSAGLQFLFISSQVDNESSALAGDLFSRFNDTAQLRLYSRGGEGCDLLDLPGVKQGIVQWLLER